MSDFLLWFSVGTYFCCSLCLVIFNLINIISIAETKYKQFACSFFAYFSTLKMEAIFSIEISVKCYGLHGVKCQKIVLFLLKLKKEKLLARSIPFVWPSV
jgi:hypothetical protein